MRSPSRPACGEGGSAIVYLRIIRVEWSRIIEWSGVEASRGDACVCVCQCVTCYECAKEYMIGGSEESDEE